MRKRRFHMCGIRHFNSDGEPHVFSHRSEPLQGLVPATFELGRTGARFPNPRPKPRHLAAGLQQTGRFQHLLPGLRTARSGHDERAVGCKCREGEVGQGGRGDHGAKIRRIPAALPESAKPREIPEASIFVPGTGLEPARPKAQPPEDCASTNFATRVG